MYQVISSYAHSIGLYKDSKDWTKEDIDKVNEVIEQNKDLIREIATEHYKSYIQKAHLDLYPKCCQDVIFSLYVNSPKYSLMAVQRSIIKMVKSNRLGLTLNEVSIDDGYWGNKTRLSLHHILSQKSQDFHYYFEEAIINNMEDIYEEIADTEAEKKNLKGWKNRVRYFQEKE